MTVDNQVKYLGRWVDRDTFRAFVYNSSGKKLCNSYDEFERLISSGVWKDSEHETEIEIDNIVSMKKRRGRKCQNPVKA